MVVCLTAKGIDKIINEKVSETLSKKKFKPGIPPQMTADRTIIVKDFSPRLPRQTPDWIKQDLTTGSTWLKVKEMIRWEH